MMRDTKSIVDQYKQNNISIDNFIEKLTGTTFEVNRWGSCQYSTILAMYDALKRLHEEGYDPTLTMGWKPLNDYCENVNTLDYVKEKLLQYLIDREEDFSDDEPSKYDLMCLDDIECLDPLFIEMRIMGRDLLSAVGDVRDFTFKDKSLFKNIDVSHGVGPELNVMAQSENYVIGLCCFLLVHIGYVKDPDQSFGNFDT